MPVYKGVYHRVGSHRPFTTAQRDRLREAAEIIANAARIISSRFSVRIPANTYVSPETENTIRVITDKIGAPNAYPFEEGVFHPLFGHPPWYKQPHRPYMNQAVDWVLDDAADAYGNVINDWAYHYGFDGP